MPMGLLCMREIFIRKIMNLYSEVSENTTMINKLLFNWILKSVDCALCYSLLCCLHKLLNSLRVMKSFERTILFIS